VNLTDGGHFENLGLYEMVLRRCRNIVVCDAGADPSVHFTDLGNAIRKIRVDFGISIDFPHGIQVRSRSDGARGFYWALGDIHYGDADGAGAQPGTILYLRPAYYGRAAPPPYDVFSYAEATAAFPHESTVDQWFDESQFESYRELGRFVAHEMLGDGPQMTVAEAFKRASDATTAAAP
jgi:hypothetical protein